MVLTQSQRKWNLAVNCLLKTHSSEITTCNRTQGAPFVITCFRHLNNSQFSAQKGCVNSEVPTVLSIEHGLRLFTKMSAVELFFRQGQAVACSKLPLWAWLQPLSNCKTTVGSQKALMIPSLGPPRACDLCVCLWVCLTMYLCRSAEDTSLSELNYLLQVCVWQKLLRPRRLEGKLHASALISV